VRCKTRFDILNRSDADHECDGQTDRTVEPPLVIARSNERL